VITSSENSLRVKLRIVYHEAGHLTAAHVLNIPVDAVAIGNTRGYVKTAEPSALLMMCGPVGEAIIFGAALPESSNDGDLNCLSVLQEIDAHALDELATEATALLTDHHDYWFWMAHELWNTKKVEPQ
jgi:hypothetical protein